MTGRTQNLPTLAFQVVNESHNVSLSSQQIIPKQQEPLFLVNRDFKEKIQKDKKVCVKKMVYAFSVFIIDVNCYSHT